MQEAVAEARLAARVCGGGGVRGAGSGASFRALVVFSLGGEDCVAATAGRCRAMSAVIAPCSRRMRSACGAWAGNRTTPHASACQPFADAAGAITPQPVTRDPGSRPKIITA